MYIYVRTYLCTCVCIRRTNYREVHSGTYVRTYSTCVCTVGTVQWVIIIIYVCILAWLPNMFEVTCILNCPAAKQPMFPPVFWPYQSNSIQLSAKTMCVCVCVCA